MGNHSLLTATEDDLRFDVLTEKGCRSFGSPQSWSDDQRGVGGELLIADILAAQVNAAAGGSVLFLGLDLGKRDAPYLNVVPDPRVPLKGFGGDVDVALFLREYQVASPRYASSRRGLQQDHLVLIDSKQYSKDWRRDHHFERAERVLGWFRHTLSHPRLLGGGNDPGSLRMSYHFAHTGAWVPDSWFSRVDGVPNVPEQVLPNFRWWNSQDDLVLESPVEVLLGQLSLLLSFTHPDYRPVVPRSLWDLLAPRDRKPYQPFA